MQYHINTYFLKNKGKNIFLKSEDTTSKIEDIVRIKVENHVQYTWLLL